MNLQIMLLANFCIQAFKGFSNFHSFNLDDCIRNFRFSSLHTYNQTDVTHKQAVKRETVTDISSNRFAND